MGLRINLLGEQGEVLVSERASLREGKVRVSTQTHFRSFLSHRNRIPEVPVFLATFHGWRYAQKQAVTIEEVYFLLARLSAFDLSIIEFSDDFRHVWTLRFWTLGRWVQNRVSHGVDSSNSQWTAMDTKKPAGLVPCGLSGLQRTILVSPRKNFGGAGGS